MSKQTFFLVHDAARQALHRAIDNPRHDGWMAQLSEPTRTLEQNSAQWPYLEGFAQQKQLCINGEMVWATSDDWKDVLTASLRRTRIVPGIDAGTFVPLGMRTSQMTKEEISELLELIYAFGAERGVKFRELELVS